ncbi:MAG: hypothetical protein R3B45_04725 [Bdellovibrionota bacterium]
MLNHFIFFAFIAIGFYSCDFGNTQKLAGPQKDLPYLSMSTAGKNYVTGKGSIDALAKEPLFTSRVPLRLVNSAAKTLLESEFVSFPPGSNPFEIDEANQSFTLTFDIMISLEEIIGSSFPGLEFEKSDANHKVKLTIQPDISYEKIDSNSYFSNIHLRILSLKVDDIEFRGLISSVSNLASIIISSSAVAKYIKLPDSLLRDGEPFISKTNSKKMIEFAKKYLASGALVVSSGANYKSGSGESIVSELIPIVTFKANLNHMIGLFYGQDIESLERLLKDSGINVSNKDEAKEMLKNIEEMAKRGTLWELSVSARNLGVLGNSTSKPILDKMVSITVGYGLPPEGFLSETVESNKAVSRRALSQNSVLYRLFTQKRFEDSVQLYLEKEILKSLKTNADLFSNNSNVSDENAIAKFRSETPAISSFLKNLFSDASRILDPENENSKYAGSPSLTFNEEVQRAYRQVNGFLDKEIDNRRLSKQWLSPDNSSQQKQGYEWPILTMQLSEQALNGMGQFAKDIEVNEMRPLRRLQFKFIPGSIGALNVSGVMRSDFNFYLKDAGIDLEKSFPNKPTDQIENIIAETKFTGIPFSLNLQFFMEEAAIPSNVVANGGMSKNSQIKIKISDLKLFHGKQTLNLSYGVLEKVALKIAMFITAQMFSKQDFSLLNPWDPKLEEILEKSFLNAQQALRKLKSTFETINKENADSRKAIAKIMDSDVNNNPYIGPKILIPASDNKDNIEEVAAINFQSFARAEKDTLIIDFNPYKMTEEAFPVLHGLQVWNAGVASRSRSDEYWNRPDAMNNVNFFEVSIGSGLASNTYRKYISERSIATQAATSQKLLTSEKKNPIDLRLVLSTQELNKRIADIIGQVKRFKEPKDGGKVDSSLAQALKNISIAGIYYELSKMSLFVKEKSDNGYDPLELEVMLTAKDSSYIKIKGEVELKSVMLTDTIKELNLEEILFGEQALEVRFKGTPTIETDSLFFQGGKILLDGISIASEQVNNILAKIFPIAKWGSDLTAKIANQILGSILFSIFEAATSDESGQNMVIGGIKIHSYVKLLKYDGEKIVLVLNPRMISPQYGMSLMPPDLNGF